ncbi:MAG TPA: hypothetical protein VL588_12110 [Bdellovibrionota bacterium]|nr:hypothetical protein [Bdellovibrionota bacterium]
MKRAVLVLLLGFCLAPRGAAAAEAVAAADPSEYTPFMAHLLLASASDDHIGDLEWLTQSAPVYLVPVKGGAQPYVRLEAELKRQGWALFFNDQVLKHSEDRTTHISIEVPLVGENTQVELIGSLGVVNLQREIVMVHFAEWKQLQQKIQHFTHSEVAPPATLSAEAGLRSAAGVSAAAVRLASLSAEFGTGWRLAAGAEGSLSGTRLQRFDLDLGLRLPWGNGVWNLTLGGLLALGFSNVPGGPGGSLDAYQGIGPQAAASFRKQIFGQQTWVLTARAAYLLAGKGALQPRYRWGGTFLWCLSHPELNGLFLRGDYSQTSFKSQALTALQVTLGYQFI